MRPAALSDPENFSYITNMAKEYPNVKLVLAHCARGFASWTAVSKVQQLEDTGNIWFDLSAICEPSPMMACILKNAGKRTVWGTDYPSCLYRGRAISIGKGQNWLIGPAFSELNRSYILCESLMALYQSALLLNLDATQIEDIFYNNAIQLFNIN